MQYIVIVGNLVDGLKFYGPFDETGALNFMMDHCPEGATVAPLNLKSKP